MKLKGYLLYAIGEIILIVIGILLAMYISNRNVNQHYKSQIDNNITRVYFELEQNIDNAKKNLSAILRKDSLLHLILEDSLTTESYSVKGGLPYTIVQAHQLKLEDKAFFNLIQLNVSDNKYMELLISNIKDLYSQNSGIKDINNKMSKFVDETSIPFLIQNIDSFGDLTFREILTEDAVNYFLTSKDYKKLVVQYAILVDRSHLENVRNYFKKSMEIYNQISKQYNLVNKFKINYDEEIISSYEGFYTNDISKDTFEISQRNDSLFLRKTNKEGGSVSLNQFKKNRYFLDGGGQWRYFLSFYKNQKEEREMKIHLMNTLVECRKIKN